MKIVPALANHFIQCPSCQEENHGILTAEKFLHAYVHITKSSFFHEKCTPAQYLFT